MARRRTQASKSEASTQKVLKAALSLFSRQGFRATSMRQLARRAGLSVGNLYHHFGNKERIFQRLIDRYWDVLLDPDLPLNRIFAAARFPEDLEEMAAAIEQVVTENAQSILLIYIDVIEFKGKHIRAFYQQMADRFRSAYSDRIAEMKRRGEVAEGVDPLVGVMLATRWFFYYFTVEKCFGVPMHMGLEPKQAVNEFAKVLRFGLLPRMDAEAADLETDPRLSTRGGNEHVDATRRPDA
ncbi:MAG TPA: TetR/AcrR family transcriptional regulator [Thermoanaerobaculia bacterium]|jgi:AcrR family transcriptional regulator|nr:TetR/AcrR family transcriptional regulator [Thermoanaerobaculia bacterium]